MNQPHHDTKTENAAGLPPGFSYNTVHHAQMSQTSPASDSASNPSQSTLPEKYSVAGIISLMSRANPDLAALSTGMELHTLGIPHGAPDLIYPHLRSCVSDQPATLSPVYPIPLSYYHRPAVLDTNVMRQYPDDALFYAVYYMPNDIMQVAAAKELYNRGWAYAKDLETWARQPNEYMLNSARIPPEEAQGVYLVFNYQEWKPRLLKNTSLQFATMEEVCE